MNITEPCTGCVHLKPKTYAKNQFYCSNRDIPIDDIGSKRCPFLPKSDKGKE